MDSLDDKRVFKQFVDSFVDYLGLKSGDLDSDLVETIMDSEESAEEWLRENNDLLLNDEFQREMEQLKPASRGRFVGKRADEEDIIEDGGRHVVTVPEKQKDFLVSATTPRGLSPDNLGLSDAANAIDTEVETAIAPLEDASDVAPEEYEEERTEDDSEVNGDRIQPSPRPRSGMSLEGSGQDSTRRRNGPSFNRPPKPFSAEDIKKFGSHGRARCLEVSEPTQPEVDELSAILEGHLTPAQIADQNYLAQLRLYHNLVRRGMKPEETVDEFVKDGTTKDEHRLIGGKYIHKCSAAGGILYLSPSIWNKLADDKCVVCVYLGAKANDFMYFNSIQDILTWIEEDDILIKMTGEEKVRAVNALYTGVLDGVKGTAYTLLRIQYNEHYNSFFEPLDEGAVSGQTDSPEAFG